MDALSAKISVGIRRRNRASRMSCPSLRSARRTGIGVAELELDLGIRPGNADVTWLSVSDIRRYCQVWTYGLT